MQNIRAIRKALKLSQMEFSKAIGVTQSYLSQIEIENKFTTLKHLETIIEKFGVSPDWYFKGVGDMFSVPSEPIQKINIPAVKALIYQIEINLAALKELIA